MIRSWLLGALSLVLYATFVPLSWTFAGRTSVLLRSAVGLDSLPWLDAGLAYVALAAILTGLLAVYLLVLRSPARVREHGRAFLLGVPLAACVILLASSPLLSHDLFLYTAYGRMAAILGLNPYVHTISEAGSDPIVALQQGWGDTQASYGPVWLLVAAGATAVTGSPLLLVLLLRLVTIGGYLLGLALVRRLARAAGADETRASLAYAWNPLLILETASNGHHEVVLLALVLLALVAHRRFGPAAALPMLAVSALIKPVGAFLTPLYLVYAWRERPAQVTAFRIVLGSVSSLAIMIAAYAPFWAGPQVLLGLAAEGVRYGSASLPDALRAGLLRLFPGQPDLATFVVTLGTLLPVVSLYFLLIYRVPPLLAPWLDTAATLLLVYVVLANSHPREWYLLWPFVLAAPLADRRIGRVAIAFTIAATLFYAGPGLLDRPMLKVAFTVVCFALPGLLLLRHLWLGVGQASRRLGGEPATVPEG